MEALTNQKVVKQLLEKHGFTFRQSLGQNFLVNPSVCPKMATLSGANAQTGVLEIGPGIGTLTVELAKRAAKVVAIELDKRLLPVLEETLAPYDQVTVIGADAMKVDLSLLLKEQFPGMPVVVCANLPYYITSPFVMRLLEEQLPVIAITVMVQKEAGVRLCAAPGTREAGAVSLAVQYYSEPSILFQVSKGSFMPAPKVDSAVIQLSIRKGQKPCTPEVERTLFRLIRAAFSQRRKMLAGPVSKAFGISKDEVKNALVVIGKNGTQRAEELTLPDFIALAQMLLAIEK